MLSKKQGSTVLNTYTNAFDAAGNLGSVSYIYTENGSTIPDTYTFPKNIVTVHSFGLYIWWSLQRAFSTK